MGTDSMADVEDYRNRKWWAAFFYNECSRLEFDEAMRGWQIVNEYYEGNTKELEWD